MTKLTSKARDEVAALLEVHSELSAAEAKIGKRGISAGITTNNDKDDSDWIAVTIDTDIAKAAVAQQKAVVAKKLAKLGIEIG